MVKAVDKAAVITDVRVETKTGGRSGDWSDRDTPMKAAVVVASNRAAAGVYADETGPLITAWLTDQGFTADEPVVVPDGDPVGEAISAAVDRRRARRAHHRRHRPHADRPHPRGDAPAARPRGARGSPRRSAPTGWPTGSRPRCSRAGSPASSAPAWWSTCRARAAASRTGSPCWRRC